MIFRHKTALLISIVRVCCLTLAGGILFSALPGFAADPLPPTTEKEKVYYAIGYNMASNLKQQGIEVDLDLVILGMREALSDEPNLLNDEEIRIATQKYQTQVRLKRSKNVAKNAGDNRLTGEAFLARNKSAEGVVALPSGLQYKVLKAGDGRKPTANDVVEVAFRGTRLDGQQFDATPRDRTSSAYQISNTLPAWQEALKLMPVGSKWQLFVPPALGYGSRGKGAVGPNMTLIYELELLAIQASK